jgi:hypothetical protein
MAFRAASSTAAAAASWLMVLHTVRAKSSFEQIDDAEER